jgi:hypothetical protein
MTLYEAQFGSPKDCERVWHVSRKETPSHRISRPTVSRSSQARSTSPSNAMGPVTSLQREHVGGRNYGFIKRRRVNHVEKQYACHDRNAANPDNSSSVDILRRL